MGRSADTRASEAEESGEAKDEIRVTLGAIQGSSSGEGECELELGNRVQVRVRVRLGLRLGFGRKKGRGLR